MKPRAIRSMVRCMTEALRIRKCKWLESAMWIFLGFDDKNGLKLLRFKRDASAEAESSSHMCFDAVNAESSSQTRIDSVRAAGDPFWLQYGAQIGVVGCMPVGLEYLPPCVRCVGDIQLHEAPSAGVSPGLPTAANLAG